MVAAAGGGGGGGGGTEAGKRTRSDCVDCFDKTANKAVNNQRDWSGPSFFGGDGLGEPGYIAHTPRGRSWLRGDYQGLESGQKLWSYQAYT